ncbi:hypothetical protein P7K49_019013, partial [Saguinus oedipus]
RARLGKRPRPPHPRAGAQRHLFPGRPPSQESPRPAVPRRLRRGRPGFVSGVALGRPRSPHFPVCRL